MVSVFAHFLSEILIKHGIKEHASKGNIWCPFYITKGGGLGGGFKKIYINPNPNKYIQEFIIVSIPTCYSTFLNESLQKPTKILPSCRYLKAEDIDGEILAARIL